MCVLLEIQDCIKIYIYHEAIDIYKKDNMFITHEAIQHADILLKYFYNKLSVNKQNMPYTYTQIMYIENAKLVAFNML